MRCAALFVPSQAFTLFTVLAAAFAGWPGDGVPRTPNTGGTFPAAAPLTAKIAGTRVEIPLVKFSEIFVMALAELLTVITASNRRPRGRPILKSIAGTGR